MKLLVFLLFFSSSTLLYSQPDADYYYNKALSYAQSERYYNAIDELKRALELYPDSQHDKISLTYWEMSTCYIRLKEFSEAISACNLWLDKGGIYTGNAYEILGISYFNKGEYSNSIDAFSKAIENSYWVEEDSPLDLKDIYRYIKESYNKLGNSYGWIPKSQFWKVDTPHGYWKWEDMGKICCINTFAVRVKNTLPITIHCVNIDLIIKDKKGTVVYRRNHTAWVNGLKTNEVIQSDYFNLTNEVCLPCSYLSSEKFSWTSEITGVGY